MSLETIRNSKLKALNGINNDLSTENGLKIINVVATLKTGYQLNLSYLLVTFRDAEYNPKAYPAVIVRLHAPNATLQIFENGKIIILGCKSEESCHLAARIMIRLLQLVGYKDSKLLNFQIHNMVSTTNVGFPIDILSISENNPQMTHYEPELFPALFYKLFRPRLTILVFVNGKILIMGGKSTAQIHEAWKSVLPYLEKYKKKSHVD